MMYDDLHKLYPSGYRITNKELKAQIQILYNKYGITNRAKATDITLYGFTTHPVKITVDGIRLNGLELKWV